MVFQALVVALCGVLFSAAFPPVGLWFLVLSLIPLFYTVADSRYHHQAFWLGFWFAVPFYALHLFWLPSGLSDIFGWVAWIIYPPLTIILAVFQGIVCWLSRGLGGRGHGALWTLPGFWLLMEWARTQGPLAFPWGNPGYIWLGTPLAQAADIAGSYGLSFATLVMSALLCAALLPREVSRGAFNVERRRAPVVPVILTAIIAAALYGYGLYRLSQPYPAADRQALLVQGNTDPLGRSLGESDLEVYTRLTASAMARLVEPVDLVIWPEAAVIGEFVTGMRGQETRERIWESAQGTPVITGASIWETTTERYNSVIGIEDAQISGRYDKVYTVPFGESVPFAEVLEPLYRIVYGWFGLLPSTTAPGQSFTPITTSLGTAAAYICYESVFPQVARNLVARGGEVLINISNDAWFGRGNGAEQHFAMGTMRAIETRRYLLRVGNDGITAVVSPHGETLQRLERFIAGSMVGNFALMRGETVYVRFGDWLIWLAAGYLLLTVVVLVLRR
jgi:apolipoprotein N-acyltransferase